MALLERKFLSKASTVPAAFAWPPIATVSVFSGQPAALAPAALLRIVGAALLVLLPTGPGFQPLSRPSVAGNRV